MPCLLCGANHTLLHCSTFARVPQPVKDAVKQLWDADPQGIAVGSPLEDWIYENVYSPGSGQQPALGWTYHYSPSYQGSDIVACIEERVYLSVKGARLLYVWQAIQPLFSGIGNTDVIQAKHCPHYIADGRPDSIVIYLRNKAAVWRFCDGLRDLRRQAKITDTDFKTDTPPGAGRIADLPGVSTARQPDDPGQSFGGELCHLLGETFDAKNRPMRIPYLDFLALCLASMKQAGIDITKPWNRPRQIL
ncbi:hypothetical protein CDN99_21745 [Roseateles aquatilis]|uniref:Uncharacterized protein n=1 Tax=Roseateles aquatilis TaxID=431061 RepID=A0A246IZC9_9BURK|nr:T3SS effector HopA1 family protein [Roseateles aquatilis]OWQ85703.1 hypothetical protein CDN99_21745 [Roseateles aquatilis]